MLNQYFGIEKYNVPEQDLIQKLRTEVIQHKGMDVWYIKRQATDDTIYQDDPTEHYVSATQIEMYLNNFQGYAGQSDIFTKFEFEIRDECNLTVSRERFDQDIGTLYNIPRPLEGDLIYIPMMHDYFEIMYVDPRKIFFQLGGYYSYELRCDKFEYSQQIFSTGVPEIDQIMNMNQRELDANGNPAQSNGIPTFVDPTADNLNINNEASVFLDFSEGNPFSE